ncbi:anti-sigma factor [Microbacterium sp. STN6]|uniref:anti-sigma factor n=1 Tax=Microbacterium sp. STN6 TaxID=2995588 RepID=UPI002260F048|nr:anti-sigma factor [Microbacterium sp. STN6]MCX7520755.1 anti-sigma factor [Microbacterium sp. STN6]
MTADDERAKLAAGHALGSLTPEEEAEYGRYLAESAEHRLEATEFEQVAKTLAFSQPQVTPPPELKQRLMAQIQTMPQRPRAGETASSAGSPISASSPAAERARVRWFRRPVAMTVAAAAAAVVLFVGGLALGNGIHPATPPVSAQSDVLAQISAAPDAQRASVTVTGGGEATLVWSPSLAKSAVVVDGVAQAPAGKTYQLWYIHDSDARSAGLLSLGGSRSWQVLSGTMRAGDAVGITIEPAGGSKAPTTKPVAVFTA